MMVKQLWLLYNTVYLIMYMSGTWHLSEYSFNGCPALDVGSRDGDDQLASEQLVCVGFGVFLSRMNNYPGVAAKSGDNTNSA